MRQNAQALATELVYAIREVVIAAESLKNAAVRLMKEAESASEDENATPAEVGDCATRALHLTLNGLRLDRGVTEDLAILARYLPAPPESG